MAEASEAALDLSGLRLFVGDRIGPFFRRILGARPNLVLALHVIGSAVTEDFDPERSDINSMIVLREMDLDFMDVLGPLCREFAGERIQPPRLMTPKSIEQQRTASPIELLDLRLINVRVFGEDFFSRVEIDRPLVGVQCKQELRNRLIELGWGYVRAAGNKRELTELLHDSVFGLAPLVRGILYVRGEEPPVSAATLFNSLAALVGPAALSFKEVYWTKRRDLQMPVARVRATLKDYYRAIETLIDLVDQAAQ